MLWAAGGWSPPSASSCTHLTLLCMQPSQERFRRWDLFLEVRLHVIQSMRQLREAGCVCLPTLSKCLLCAALPGKFWRLEQQQGGGALPEVCANSV